MLCDNSRVKATEHGQRYMLHSTVNVLHYITQYKAKMLVKIKFLQILAHGAAILDDGLRMTEVAPSF